MSSNRSQSNKKSSMSASRDRYKKKSKFSTSRSKERDNYNKRDGGNDFSNKKNYQDYGNRRYGNNQGYQDKGDNYSNNNNNRGIRDNYGYDNNRGGYNNSNYNNNNNNRYNNNRSNNDDQNYVNNQNSQFFDSKKPFQHLTMRRYRDKNESHIRVHFFIRDAFVKNGDSEQFIFLAKEQIQKCGQIDILQMLNHNPKGEYADLAIGMRYDDDAKKVMDGIRIIKLIDKNGKLLNQSPEITQVFKKALLDHESFNADQKIKKNRSSVSRDKKKRKNSNESSVSKSDRSRSRSKSLNKKKEKDGKKSTKYQTAHYDKRVLFFGIPVEFDENDLKKALIAKGVEVVSMAWEKTQSMDYLAVTFQSQVQYDIVCDEVITLDREELVKQTQQTVLVSVPLLILKENPDVDVNEQLQNYQVRLDYTSPISPITIFKMFKKYGTIVNLFQDNQSLQIIYSQPHEKLTLKIPQTLDVMQAEPYEELKIDIKKVTQTESIDRQEFQSTIHYQMQIMEHQQQFNREQQQQQQNQQQQVAQNNQDQKEQSNLEHENTQKKHSPPPRSKQSRESSKDSRSSSLSTAGRGRRDGKRSASQEGEKKNVFKLNKDRQLIKDDSIDRKSIDSDRGGRTGSRGYNSNYDRDSNNRNYSKGNYNNNSSNYRKYSDNNNRGGNHDNNGNQRYGNNNNNRDNRGTNYGRNFNSYNEKNYNSGFNQHYGGNKSYNNNDRGGGDYDRNRGNRGGSYNNNRGNNNRKY